VGDRISGGLDDGVCGLAESEQPAVVSQRGGDVVSADLEVVAPALYGPSVNCARTEPGACSTCTSACRSAP
jgi:hypothetical protein